MNILTFDIEEWYLEKILHGSRAFRFKQFDETFDKLLEFLNEKGVKATFFVVAKEQEYYPAYQLC